MDDAGVYRRGMIKSFLSKLAAAFTGLIGKEPITFAGIGVIALALYKDATASGLVWDDAFIFVAMGLFLALGRQLVYPAVKVDASTGAVNAAFDEFEARHALPAPYLGENDE